MESFPMLAVSSTLNVLNFLVQSASSSAPAITYRSVKSCEFMSIVKQKITLVPFSKIKEI